MSLLSTKQLKVNSNFKFKKYMKAMYNMKTGTTFS